MKIAKVWDNFVRAIGEIFTDSRVFVKFGVIFGLNFIVGLISQVIRLVGLSVDFWPVYMAVDTRQFLSSLFGSILPIAVAFLTLPVWLYKKGYLYDIANRIRISETPLLPEHDDRGKQMKLGSAFLSINYTLTIAFALLSIAPFILILVFGQNINSAQGAAILFAAFIASLVVGFLFSLVIAFISVVLVPCLMYIFLKHRDLSMVFEFKRVWEVMRDAFWSLIILFFAAAGLRIAFSIMEILLCCINPIISPLMQTLSMFLYAAALGAIYKELG
jgi:hypothetical protein